MRAFDLEIDPADAIREARAGNGFLLWRYLGGRVSNDVRALLLDILDGNLHAPVRNYADEFPSKAEVEALIERVASALKQRDPEYVAWARQHSHSLTAFQRTAVAYAAAVYCINPRTVKEIRYPQPGRLKRKR